MSLLSQSESYMKWLTSEMTNDYSRLIQLTKLGNLTTTAECFEILKLEIMKEDDVDVPSYIVFFL